MRRRAVEGVQEEEELVVLVLVLEVVLVEVGMYTQEQARMVVGLEEVRREGSGGGRRARRDRRGCRGWRRPSRAQAGLRGPCPSICGRRTPRLLLLLLLMRSRCSPPCRRRRRSRALRPAAPQ